jgi:hypothetical protein
MNTDPGLAVKLQARLGSRHPRVAVSTVAVAPAPAGGIRPQTFYSALGFERTYRQAKPNS